jgi:hypothetical protein
MISDKKQMLLEALLDGEIDARRELSLRDEMQKDSTLTNAYSDLQSIRANVREWFNTQVINEVDAREIDVWSSISSKVEEIVENSHQGRQSIFEGIFENISKLRQSFVTFRPVPTFVVSLIAVFSVYFLVIDNNHKSSENILLAKTSEPLATTPTETVSIHPLVVTEDANINYLSQIRRVQGDIVSTGFYSNQVREQLLEQNFVLGGLRTGGMDIHWIKSREPVQIVSAIDRTHPPVIWVSYNRASTSSSVRR